MGKPKVLFGDTETTGVQDLYNKTPREQFRLGQWAWGRNGEVHLTEDYDEFMHQVEQADLLVFHNLFYDTTVMWGKDSTRPLEMALERRLLDTFLWAPQRIRIPIVYENRAGNKATTYRAGKQNVGLTKRFLSLDNLAHYFGTPGKMGDLKELAKKYNPKGTKNDDLDFGLIPTDDPEFREYARQDIIALQGVAGHLMDMGPISSYEWREMLTGAINNQMSKNGFTVDLKAARARVEELSKEKERVMSSLVADFDFPTEGKSPWASTAGQVAILGAMESFGVTPDNTDWPRTPTGALKMGGDDLKDVATQYKTRHPDLDGEPLDQFVGAIATLKGQRSLAQLAIDSTHDDGKAHPEVTSLQRSGRFSMTNPSLPIWTARGPGAIEKRYFTASPGCKLVEMDFSNADQRIVAALAGDPEYAKRFLPGADGHEISGRLMFGDEQYDSDPAHHRQIAKALSHAYAYGAGPKTLARTADQPLKLAQKFVNAMDSAYPWNSLWRDTVRKEGDSGWVTNHWGRRMAVDADRSFTQSPGLLGQSGTRELLVDGLIDIVTGERGLEVIRWLVATVHDAIIWDIPEEELEWAVPHITKTIERTFDPGTAVSQPIFFPLTAGEPADDWFGAGH